MNAEIVEMIRWFAEIGEREYPPVPGTLAMLDLKRLRTDRDYGLKCFLTYMGARAGAPGGYVPAWLKTVEKRVRVGGYFAELFRNFYHGRPNERLNPMWDQQLANLDVPSCVEHVQRGELSPAFAKLKVSGAGHKIRALFLLDLAVFTDADPADPNSWTIAEQYLYCQPVDVWVDFVSVCFKELDQEPLEGLPTTASQYDLSPATIEKAYRMINLALKAGVSPLKLNQGVWFFAAYVAADKQRLKTLLSTRRVEALDEELELMRGFLPSDAFSGPLGELLPHAKMLPEADRSALVKWLEAEVDERKWQRSFAVSRDQLSELAGEALAEYRAGRTEVLDPDKL
jgi:hypothetical protein